MCGVHGFIGFIACPIGLHEGLARGWLRVEGRIEP